MRSRWDLTSEVRKTLTSDLIRMYEVDRKSINAIRKELRMSPATVRRLLRAVGFSVVVGNRPSTRKQYDCVWCRKILWRVPSDTNQRTFCSHACYSKWRVGKYEGANCGKWKGGVTPLQLKQLATKEWADLAKGIRRKYKSCFLCGSVEKLHVHHIVPRRDNLKLMYEESNLSLLCASCHRGIKGKENEYEQILRDRRILNLPGAVA
jgi:5-methylcytosine-specific restriction endonuclease McrA